MASVSLFQGDRLESRKKGGVKGVVTMGVDRGGNARGGGMRDTELVRRFKVRGSTRTNG